MTSEPAAMEQFEPLEKVFIRWARGADGSLNIRKWSQFPFDGATEYGDPVVLTRERDEAREALTWQPMSSAPLDREILLDVSYWYPGDTSVTACYFIGSWVSNMWDCGEELRRSDQINAWVDIPPTTLPRPAPEHFAGGKQE